MGKTHKNFFKEILCGKWFPLLLLFIMACAFATQLPELGFYLDDWVSIAAYDQGGEAGLISYGIDDSRPFAAWITAKFFAVLGTGVLQWQLITLFWRFAAALAGFYLVKSLWPEHETTAGVVSLLFSVFPFFKHQAICIAYFMILMQYFVIMLSFLLTVKALQTENKTLKIVLFILSCLTSLFHLLCLEYYLSLEGARLLLIFFVLKRKEGRSFWKTAGKSLLYYIPYALILLGVLGYRFVYIPSLSEDVRSISLFEHNQGLNLIIHLAGLFVQYLSESLLGVWYRSINPSMLDMTTRHTQLAIGLGVITAGLLVFLLYRSARGSDSEKPNANLEMLILGFAAMILGYLPGMMIDVSPSSASIYHDRYLLPSFWGISLFTVSWMSMLFKSKSACHAFFAAMVGLSVFFQIQNAYSYRYSWKNQQQFQWQMKWRVPDLAENTAVISDSVVAVYMGGWADGSMLNEMYGKKQGITPTPYWYFNVGQDDYLSVLGTDTPLGISSKMYAFETDPENVIVITQPEYGKCAWLLDEADLTNPYLIDGIGRYIKYQNKSRIRMDSDYTMPVSIFGKDYIHDWCYYFEKADLAFDRGEYEEVLHLYDEAAANGYSMGNAMEMRPFIKAAAFTGNWDKALEWTRMGYSVRPDQTKAYFINLWKLLDRDVPDSPEKREALEKANALF